MARLPFIVAGWLLVNAVASADAQVKYQVSSLRTMLEMYTYNTTTPKGDKFPKLESKDIPENYDVTGKIKKTFEAVLEDRISTMRNSINNGAGDGASRLELAGLEAVKMADNPQGKKKISSSIGEGSDIRILFKGRQFYIQYSQFPTERCQGVEFAVCGIEEEDDEDSGKPVEQGKKDHQEAPKEAKDEGWFGF